MPTQYYVNLNTTCNEACVFCAADLARRERRVRREVTMQAVAEWMGEGPAREDRVDVAGGEPTLHPDVLPILRHAGRHGAEVRLYTNGLRLAHQGFAEAVVTSARLRIELALFGATAELHDRITRTPGSLARTESALRLLTGLRASHPFEIELRLLVARQTYLHNEGIVRLVMARGYAIDRVSLNPVILSQDADECGAPVSWETARRATNEVAKLVCASGIALGVGGIPCCVLDEPIRTEALREALRFPRSGWRTMYLDPMAMLDGRAATAARAPALPSMCSPCDLVGRCHRVEPWYVDRFGTAGLRTITTERQARTRPV